jgi:hypothetical protein
MYVSWHREEGFKLDIPYSKWLIFCLGASVLISAVRWW